MISIYFNICFAWMLFMLHNASAEEYNIDGWKYPTAVVLFPGTFAAVVLGTLFTLVDEKMPFLINKFKKLIAKLR
ncbi:hypothetical protein KIT04_023 [Vibrio phage KIT04]|nr:hypothetical protein KIT04_023 [Vibrio phage KIT04]